jgi:hypothetical protein
MSEAKVRDSGKYFQKACTNEMNEVATPGCADSRCALKVVGDRAALKRTGWRVAQQEQRRPAANGCSRHIAKVRARAGAFVSANELCCNAREAWMCIFEVLLDSNHRTHDDVMIRDSCACNARIPFARICMHSSSS